MRSGLVVLVQQLYFFCDYPFVCFSQETAAMAFTSSNDFNGEFGGFNFFEKSDRLSRRAAIDRLDKLATLLDTAMVIPGTNIRFGVEGLLRLWPGIGDGVASALSLYLLYQASRLGVPRVLLARMLVNLIIEGAVGAIPIAGDAFDVFFRANRRNIALLRDHFAASGER
jgi:hypothetical protein